VEHLQRGGPGVEVSGDARWAQHFSAGGGGGGYSPASYSRFFAAAVCGPCLTMQPSDFGLRVTRFLAHDSEHA